MDMLYSDYVDMINSLMIQAFLHNCGVKDADPDVLDDYFDEYFDADAAGPDVYGHDNNPYDEDDEALIDEV